MLADVYVKHPLGDTYLGASAGSDGWTALLGEQERQRKYDSGSTGVCKFVSCRMRLYGHVSPAAMK